MVIPAAVSREMVAYIRYLARGGWTSALTPLASVVLDRLRRRPAVERVKPWYLHGPAPGGIPTLHGLPPVGLTLQRGMKVPEQLELPLATRTLTVAGRVEWGITFDDPEDTFALHRFGWVPRLLVAWPDHGMAVTLWEMVQDWIARGPRPGVRAAWHPYTVSERLVHWLILASLLGRNSIEMDGKDTVFSSVITQAAYLANHLESYGPARTNNHLTNNGRALYLAGLAVGDAALQHVGRTILTHELNRMFSSSGFLREGSSHYHLLLCRTYLEILWTAETIGDDLLVDTLRWPVSQMVERARFFNAGDGGPMPLIGDVSPDCPPEWLVPIAGLGEGGWLELWARDVKGEAIPSGFSGFADAGWHRYVGTRYCLFLHTGTRFTLAPGTHAHHDVGGFELRADGVQLIADPGRPSYQRGRWGEGLQGAGAHAAITVDGYEPFVSEGCNWARFMPEAYIQHEIQTEWVPALHEFTVAHNGFARLGNVGWWRRVFRFLDDGVTVSDLLEGCGKRTLQATFPLHPQVHPRREGNSLVLEAKGTSRWVLTWDVPDCWMEIVPQIFSSAYGSAVASTCVRIRWRTELPCQGRFSLRTGD